MMMTGGKTKKIIKPAWKFPKLGLKEKELKTTCTKHIEIAFPILHVNAQKIFSQHKIKTLSNDKYKHEKTDDK